MNIKDKLKTLQLLSGKTQAELALLLGVTTLAFSNWWNGKSLPRKNALRKIDGALLKYGISDSVKSIKNESGLSIQKRAVFSIAKKHRNIFKKIISRTDLVDELSLQITYNSNAIEGSTLTREDAKNVIFENKVLGNKTLIEQLEAKNHDKAFRYLLKSLENKEQVGELLVKKLHKILLAGIRDDAGMYRSDAVRIVGSYVPTANHIKVPDLMKKLFTEKFAEKDTLNRVSRFHANFEKIHPFADGNGRVGRLLMIGILLYSDMAPAIITKKRRPEYYKALQQAQLHENFNPIENFICEAVLEGYKIIGE